MCSPIDDDTLAPADTNPYTILSPVPMRTRVCLSASQMGLPPLAEKTSFIAYIDNPFDRDGAIENAATFKQDSSSEKIDIGS